MPDIKLPDGKKISFKDKIDGFEIAKKISKSLAKEACVMEVNGELKDLSYQIEKDSKVKIITSKNQEGLDAMTWFIAELKKHIPIWKWALLTSGERVPSECVHSEH